MATIIDIDSAQAPAGSGPAHEGGCSGGCCAAGGGCPRATLHSHDWLADIPAPREGMDEHALVEVVFKNTRKGFYHNPQRLLDLSQGDLVVVEGAPGTDLGTVTLTGPLVALQMKRARVKASEELKKVLRKPTAADLDKWEEAKARENDTMIRSRRIADDLKLNMKIGDVEYTGDGSKAIFYYIADERVDFRQLIKVLAETFKVRVEMKQIGARQEAGRIGGIGPCGRPLCCATWMSGFTSVGTAAARYQDLSLNPQKLAGQCAKLKCCLNFEIDAYVEAVKQLPPRDVRLETLDATWYHFKTDIFKKEITYSSDKRQAANLTTLSAERVFEIIEMNKAGEKPEVLNPDAETEPTKAPGFVEIVGQDSLTRFDKKKKRKKKAVKGQAAPAQQPKPEKPDKPEKPEKPEKPKAPKPQGTPLAKPQGTPIAKPQPKKGKPQGTPLLPPAPKGQQPKPDKQAPASE